MTSETKILGTALILSLVMVVGAVIFLSKGNDLTVSESKVFNIDYSKGQKIGSDSARVKLAEFSDLQCPACGAVEPYVQQIRNKYQDNIQFIYFHFPLMQHVHARKAANFAEYAATQNKFWEIHDKLFETQESWAVLSDPSDYFAGLGAQFGLDKDKIKDAISNNTYDQRINEDITGGNIAGVNSTPTFYLNGKKLKLQSFADLDAAIAQELNK